MGVLSTDPACFSILIKLWRTYRRFRLPRCIPHDSTRETTRICGSHYPEATMPFDALFSCRNNKERSEIVQKNIACHQKLWYYENEKVSIVGTCPAERRYPMNVTVADCLKLPTLREAQLIAGAKGTDRAVSSVSVLEWPETNLLSDELIVGNELVISALVTIKDDVSRQCSVLRHLRSMGAAGLVLFYVGVFIPQIDDALIAVADEINLPLIAMPFGRMDFRYSDMITDIVEYIHKRRMQGNYYTAEVMNSIALLEPQQRNINTVLRLLSDRMRCTLLLTDRYLERRGAAAWPVSNQWNYHSLLQMAQRQKPPPKGQQRMELDGHSFRLWDIPVPSKTHRGMHLLVLDEFDQMDPERLQQAVDVVALYLNIWDKGTYYDGTDALVEAVLTDDPAKMRRLAQQMGISISAVNTMWVLQLSDLRTGQELTASQKLDVVLKLKVYLQEHHKIVIVDSYGTYIVALTDGMLLEENTREMGEAFVSLLEKEGYAARGCVFDALENTSQARDAYNRMIRCFAELCAVYPRRKIYSDSDVRYVQSCIDYVKQGEESVASCLLPIRKLKDTADGDILIETLCTYLLDAESNTQSTVTCYIFTRTPYTTGLIRYGVFCGVIWCKCPRPSPYMRRRRSIAS